MFNLGKKYTLKQIFKTKSEKLKESDIEKIIFENRKGVRNIFKQNLDKNLNQIAHILKEKYDIQDDIPKIVSTIEPIFLFI